MADSIEVEDTVPSGLFNTAINILVAPSEAIAEIQQRPTKLFPLALALIGTAVSLIWYFSIVDFAWYVDDVLAIQNIPEDRLEESREAMLSLSQNMFMLIGVVGGTVFTLVFYTLQSTYLALISAFTGDGQKFSRWFSLVCWTSLPVLLGIAGMMMTILMSPNGQLSATELNPLTLRNLGMGSDNNSLNALLDFSNLAMIWSIGLLTMGYKQWQGSSLIKALAVITTPYLLIASIWAFVALT
ncbi:MAG: YIP1 family protein [Gammaproteobacteria bacterium]|nr:YIP1 family protein [Gammaproteobacteria bacterium]